MAKVFNLTGELERTAKRAEACALEAGLTFFDVVFEGLEAAEVDALAAYGGFPVRYASWRHGMAYERLHRGTRYGLSRIYELVINNDPTVAYLVRSNSRMEQKLVMAHVFGHADFFRNNAWFGPTDRRMLQTMQHHAAQLRRFTDRFGQEAVERVLDDALALEAMVDPFLPIREHRRGRPTSASPSTERRSLLRAGESQGQLRALGPGSALPTFDLLAFLMDHGDLQPWQREVLRIVREEAYYFLPQRMTKIMNEGWATFWHSRILTGGLLDEAEVIDFADCHAGATQVTPGQLNPYKLGLDLFRHAERRGMDLFRLRAVHNDSTFVDAVMDEEFVVGSRLFLEERSPKTGEPVVGERDWRTVKERILTSLAFGGQPRIQLRGVEAEGGLLLVHQHDGRDLVLEEAGRALQAAARLWGREACLLTLDQGEGRRVRSHMDRSELLPDEGAAEACAA